MRNQQTIGEVSRRLGLPAKTIRFYEAEGVVTAPARSESGYRLYSEADVRRFRLVRQARLLRLSLTEVKALVSQAFASECGEFADALLQRIAIQRGEIHRRVEELEELEGNLASSSSMYSTAAASCSPASGWRSADIVR